MKDHHEEGTLISLGALFAGGAAWFLRNVEYINEVMHFCILLITLVASAVGLKKVLRR